VMVLYCCLEGFPCPFNHEPIYYVLGTIQDSFTCNTLMSLLKCKHSSPSSKFSTIFSTKCYLCSQSN
jgi:hypothetical protein